MHDTKTRIFTVALLLLLPLYSHGFVKFPIKRTVCSRVPIYAQVEERNNNNTPNNTPQLNRPVSRMGVSLKHPYERTELDIMRAEIRELRDIVAELCGAILFSDDMSMLERYTAEVGVVYRDKGFKTFRHPLFARAAIRRVLEMHALQPTSFPHSWINNKNTTAS